MKRAEIAAKFDEIVEFAEIAQFIDTPVKRYSSGMYVKLAFAVAAHLEPEILIVDEVLAVGDIQFQQKCLGKMKDVSRNSGRTVLFVSHNTGSVAALTQKCILLNQGSLEVYGDTPDVIQQYTSFQRSDQATWEAPKATANPLQVTHVKILTTQGLTSSEVEMTEGFCIELDYIVRQQTYDTVVEAWIYASDGTRVVVLGDSDNDPLRTLSRAPNRYRTRLHVPGNLLNVDTYRIRIVSCAKNSNAYDYEDTLLFSIIEQKTVTARSGRGGLLSLAIKTEHEILGKN